MKRLFKVVTKNTTYYFGNKMEAKVVRDEINSLERTNYAVSKGPDHWLYGVKGTPRTHSHNNRSGGHGNGFPARKRH